MTYLFAAAVTVAAVLLRWLLDPVMGDALPLVTLFGAVAAATWVGGYRPALLVALAGYLACHYLFIPPRGTLHLDLGIGVGFVAYLFTCALIVGFAEAARRAQSRISGQRELLRVTLHSIGDAVITTGIDGRITYLNGVAESLTGWAEGEAIGQPLDAVFRIVNEATRQPAENPARRALADGRVVGLANHTILIRRDGSEWPIDDSAAPIRDERGRVSGCVLIFRDISAQRRLEREAAGRLHSARVLASIVESSDDAIVSKSLDGIIQSWNAGAERVFGHAAADAIGRHISLVIPPDRLAEEDQIIASLKAGRRVDHFETERVRADGRRILVSLTVSPVCDESGAVIGASKIARDVTQQRQAEQRERELLANATAATAKFEAFFEQGALLAGIADADGTIREVNRLSSEGCGYTREEIIGRRLWEAPWWAPSGDAAATIEAASARAAHGEGFRGELPYFGAGGTQRLADFTLLPIRDDDGQVRLLAMTGTDITERKRLEDDLRRLAADLSDADRRKNEFLAMLAHELRNPLAPISNAVRALRLRGDETAVQTALEMLERQVGQMGRLVDDLLDMSRITRGKIELRKERVEASAIVNQAVDAARALYSSMHHELTVTLPMQPVYLDADPTRLAQIVGNLLNNACKFTDKGGRIVLRLDVEGDRAVLRVRDNGIGVAPEHLSRLFEMFSQVETSLERSRDGLGIGLTLVKTLVELQGGSVEAHSEGLGRGSEFVVRLPLAADRAAARPSPPPAASAAGRRVLIVDDNEDGAESLAMLLTIMGHETHVAHDGEAAIAAAERLLPDAVLLDIGLPGLNGFEVCRHIRATPWGRDLVLIAVTGWGQEEHRRASKDAGFDTHLVKPVDHDALTALLASMTVRRRRPN